MGIGRFVTACAATLAVGGCTVLVIGMSRADAGSHGGSDAPTAIPTTQTQVHYPPLETAPPKTPLKTTPQKMLPATRTAHSTAQPSPALRSSAARLSTVSRATPRPSTSSRATPPTRAAGTSAAKAKPATLQRGVSLPLRYSTGSATRVITVVAHSTHSTTATLQAWTKAPGGGWLKYGAAVTAHVGADGLSTAPSEFTSATPIGSFTLTQAFGRYSDPGTTLPYFKTTPADWWISQAGPLYNTHQRCSSGCRFTRGSPNEHLYYETPYYRYAVVIDYNTRNAGRVRQNGGSAFFLHVTDGQPTAGCVAIGQRKLVSLLRWLRPAAQPRILIGTA